jgi:hypothetical protein
LLNARDATKARARILQKLALYPAPGGIERRFPAFQSPINGHEIEATHVPDATRKAASSHRAQVLTPPWPGVAEAMWKRWAVIGGNVGVSVISSLKANYGRHGRGGDRWP